MANPLCFFDVDGTLIDTRVAGANLVHRSAFRPAMAAVFSIDVGLEQLPHAGRTDLWIIKQLALLGGVAAADITPARIAAARDFIVAHCAERSEELTAGMIVLPGVVALLEALRSGGARLGLVTGNIASVCAIKLRACGLDRFFMEDASREGGALLGGFGGDEEDRAALVKTAISRAAALGHTPPPTAIYHTGDTPLDVEAAARAGIRGIGVATGHFSAQELRALPCGAWRVLEDVSDVPNVVRLFFEADGTAEVRPAPGYVATAAAAALALRHVIIVPGNGAGCERGNFYPTLAAALRAKGVRVTLRAMPSPDVAPRALWLPFIRDELGADAACVLVGHSSGAVAGLRLAEEMRLHALVAISVTPTDLGDENERASGYYDGEWQWNTIRRNCGHIVQFASDDDPFIPLELQRAACDGLIDAGDDATEAVGSFEYVELQDKAHYFSKRQPEILATVLRLCGAESAP